SARASPDRLILVFNAPYGIRGATAWADPVVAARVLEDRTIEAATVNYVMLAGTAGPVLTVGPPGTVRVRVDPARGLRDIGLAAARQGDPGRCRLPCHGRRGWRGCARRGGVVLLLGRHQRSQHAGHGGRRAAEPDPAARSRNSRDHPHGVRIDRERGRADAPR